MGNLEMIKVQIEFIVDCLTVIGKFYSVSKTFVIEEVLGVSPM
jgi:hypothetical protein